MGERAGEVCLGHARFDDQKQAQHVADGLTMEFDTRWVVVAHDDHWHPIDTGVEVPPPPPREGIVCAI